VIYFKPSVNDEVRYGIYHFDHVVIDAVIDVHQSLEEECKKLEALLEPNSKASAKTNPKTNKSNPNTSLETSAATNAITNS
jgi:hypothetical protein